MSTFPLAELTPTELTELFAETEYGARLKQQRRFDYPYRCNRDGTHEVVTADEWRERLGPDVNTFDHGRLMGRFGQAFARRCPLHLMERDGDILEFTGAAHDWEEVIVTDVTHSDKTAEYEAAGLDAYQQLIDEVIDPEQYPRTHQLMTETVYAVLSDREKKTELGRAFAAVEKIGYMQTAFRAWEWADEIADDRPEVAERLRWLAYDTLANNLSDVFTYAEEFNAPREYLDDVAPRIAVCLREMPEGMSGEHHYTLEKGALKRRQWRKANEDFAAMYPEFVDEAPVAA